MGIKLTDANCRQQSDRFIWWIALWEERFGGVDREGQGHDGLSARSDDDALDPQPDKGHERAEGDHDVSVVSSRLADHAAQLRVAVSPWNTTLVSCQCGVTSPLQIDKKISS